jgi:hypothetical protein
MRVAIALCAWLAPLVAVADASTPAPAPPAPRRARGDDGDRPLVRCGSPRWARMRAAVVDYCDSADPSEARACRIVTRAFDHCDPELSELGRHQIEAVVGDPSSKVLASWLIVFSPTRAGFRVDDFHRHYSEDCH